MRQTLIDISIMIVIGLTLAAIGPFGSFRFDLATRIAYWVPYCLAGYAVFRPTAAVADHLSARLDLPKWPSLIACFAIAALPMTLILFWADGGWGELPSVQAFFQMYVHVALVGTVVYAIFVLIERGKPTASDEADSDGDQPQSPFHDQLSSTFPYPLAALEMEDHYVRAHGQDGSELILMRMRDAIAMLDGIEGAQVHRSWWVARTAVKGARREGRNWRLQLESGLQAPVARDRVAELRENGWF